MQATLVRDYVGVLDERGIEESIFTELARRKAVRVEGESVMLNPRYMGVGQFYLVQVKDKPYLYRKVNDDEVEVYGLA